MVFPTGARWTWLSGPVRVDWKGLCRFLPLPSPFHPWIYLLLSSCSSSLSNKRTINRTPCSLPLNCRDHALKSSEEAEDTRRCLKMSSALPKATKTVCPKNNNKAASDRFDVLLVDFFFLFLFFFSFDANAVLAKISSSNHLLSKHLVEDNVTRGNKAWVSIQNTTIFSLKYS